MREVPPPRTPDEWTDTTRRRVDVVLRLGFVACCLMIVFSGSIPGGDLLVIFGMLGILVLGVAGVYRLWLEHGRTTR